MISSARLVATARVFFDDKHSGTEAAIFEAESSINDTAALTLARKANKAASVFIEDLSSSNNPRLKIFNQQQQIQWCGHGLLAAAHYLKKGSLRKSSFNKSTQKLNFSELQLAAGTVQIQMDKQKEQELWVGFEPLPIKACAADQELFALFEPQPCQMAKAGGENGYFILEWPAEEDIKQLTFDIQALASKTNRAIIATQAASDEFDFKLRYFAPQHGAAEDPATGSANRVLASYWQPRLDKNHFKAEQLSAAGAVIVSKIEKNKVWISGKVEISIC